MSEFEKNAINIRPVEPRDFTEMFELRKELFHEELENAGVPTETARRHVNKWLFEKSAAAWEAWLGNPQYYLRAVTQNSTLSGVFTGLHNMEDAKVPELSPHIDGQYVASIQLHSSIRRKGIGKALMEKFTGEGSRSTYLHALEGNIAARKFYEKLGFRAIALTGSIIGDTYPVRKLLMHRAAPTKLEISDVAE